MVSQKVTELVLWLSCFLVALLDVGSTWIGLNSGYKEKNPLGEYMIEGFGFSSLMIFKSIIIISMLALTEFTLEDKWRYMPPVLLSGVWLIAFIINASKLL